MEILKKSITQSESSFKIQEHIQMINSQEFYNLINREVPDCFKGSFIVHQFFLSDLKFENQIQLQEYPAIIDMIDNNNINSKDILSILSKEKANIFQKRKRLFNIIIPFDRSCEFINLIYEKYKNQIQMPFTIEGFISFLQNIKLENENQNLEGNIQYIRLIQAHKFFMHLKKEKITELFILYTPLEELIQQYPFLHNYLLENLSHSINYPSEIISGRLYLGNVNHAKSSTIVQNLKFTHILNITENIENFFENKQNIIYMQHKITDFDETEIGEIFRQCYLFIDNCLNIEKDNLIQILLYPNYKISMENRSNHNKILIHCAQGRSRSATIAIMYLMKKLQWTFSDAYSFIKSKRDYIEPNYGFQEKLIKFQNLGFCFDAYNKNFTLN